MASIDPARCTIAITGGARGIGRATAERFASRGARVLLGDLDGDLVRDVAAELDATLPGRVLGAALDVAEPGSWRELLAAGEPLGELDVLVNNAGIMPLGPLLEEPDEVTRAIVDVNLLGVVHGTKAVAPGMVARGRGQIVNVASAVGRLALAGGATYSASKFAVVGFTEATRAELAPQGVEVGMVLPTVVRTELAAGVPAARGVRPVSADDVAAVIESMVRRPRAELWVPRWTQPLTRSTQLLPRRLQEAMAHAFRADSVLNSADPIARAAYEQRARRTGSSGSPTSAAS